MTAPNKLRLPVGHAWYSLYVHVPFCVVKCGYCDFNSYVITDGESHDLFLGALDRELAISGVPTAPVSVFIGGGTPSYLDPARLTRLFEILRRHVDLDRCPEVTMEANPESLTREKAAIALASGVRRASIGVQSFRADRLKMLDRAHSADHARSAFADLRSAGFTNVNLDMMFGLPGQQLEEWQTDLEEALRLKPDHLSCYNLTFEPGTRFHHELEHGRMSRNDESIDSTIFTWTRQHLHAAGFSAYEVSNFAGRGGPCHHNDHYWLQGDYVGVGPGASSHRSGVRWTNLKALEPWARLCLSGGRPSATAETLTPKQRAGEAAWLGLRRADGVDLEQIALSTGIDVAALFASAITANQNLGFLTMRGSRLLLTDAGLLFADRVAGDFLTPPG